jgi:predicted transcriptional regulator YheO
MSYTQKYLLQRIRRVNELYVDLSEKGITNEFIYHHHIKDQFNISRATFYEYLTVPYNIKIKRLEDDEKRQLRLFD